MEQTETQGPIKFDDVWDLLSDLKAWSRAHTPAQTIAGSTCVYHAIEKLRKGQGAKEWQSPEHLFRVVRTYMGWVSQQYMQDNYFRSAVERELVKQDFALRPQFAEATPDTFCMMTDLAREYAERSEKHRKMSLAFEAHYIWGLDKGTTQKLLGMTSTAMHNAFCDFRAWMWRRLRETGDGSTSVLKKHFSQLAEREAKASSKNQAETLLLVATMIYIEGLSIEDVHMVTQLPVEEIDRIVRRIHQLADKDAQESDKKKGPPRSEVLKLAKEKVRATDLFRDGSEQQGDANG